MSTVNNWEVLLIDDDPDSLNLIHDMLVLNGIKVRSADNGANGLLMLKQFTPTLVIVDLSMPKPDGWDILYYIRAMPEFATLPVVAITAYASEKVIAQAHQAGFSALFPKPIKVNSLLEKLQGVVRTFVS